MWSNRFFSYCHSRDFIKRLEFTKNKTNKLKVFDGECFHHHSYGRKCFEIQSNLRFHCTCRILNSVLFGRRCVVKQSVLRCTPGKRCQKVKQKETEGYIDMKHRMTFYCCGEGSSFLVLCCKIGLRTMTVLNFVTNTSTLFCATGVNSQYGVALLACKHTGVASTVTTAGCIITLLIS